LEKKKEEDSNGDQDGEDNALQRERSGMRMRYLKEKVNTVLGFGQPHEPDECFANSGYPSYELIQIHMRQK
jgi:hypothetical protein